MCFCTHKWLQWLAFKVTELTKIDIKKSTENIKYLWSLTVNEIKKKNTLYTSLLQSVKIVVTMPTVGKEYSYITQVCVRCESVLLI